MRTSAGEPVDCPADRASRRLPDLSRIRLIFATCSCVLAVLVPAFGQEATKPGISLASPFAGSGERVVVGVHVDGHTPPLVGLRLDLEFPGALLDLVEVRPAFAQSELKVTETLSPEVDPDGNTQLSIEAKSAEAIAAGDVLELVFQVSATVYTDQEAVITARSGALQTMEGDWVEDLRLENGRVKISVAAAVFGCFFYMH